MKRLLHTLLFILLIATSAFSQSGKVIRKNRLNNKNSDSEQTNNTNHHYTQDSINKIQPKRTYFGIGGGLVRSVVFLSRNVWGFNDATGWNCYFTYGGRKLLRFISEYSQYNSIDIRPTWYSIKAKTLEANMQFIARFNNRKDFIYPMTGLSLNQFKGFFTGREDFQNLREKYGINTEVTSYWVGLNFGIGYEHAFGPLKAVLAYKMRVGAQDAYVKLNIMDVSYSIGLRYDFKVLTLKNLFRSGFTPTRSRYRLDLED